MISSQIQSEINFHLRTLKMFRIGVLASNVKIEQKFISCFLFISFRFVSFLVYFSCWNPLVGFPWVSLWFSGTWGLTTTGVLHPWTRLYTSKQTVMNMRRCNLSLSKMKRYKTRENSVKTTQPNKEWPYNRGYEHFRITILLADNQNRIRCPDTTTDLIDFKQIELEW